MTKTKLSRYSSTYRQVEMKTIAGWIEAGESGAVVGLAGAGKSNLLKFLCAHPESLSQYITVSNQTIVAVPVDLNNLPAYDVSTFYRLMLRSFFEAKAAFAENMQEAITNFYRQNQREQDPFLPQSALRELFFLLKAEKVRVVLVMDRFDHFCQIATPQMFNTLRGLRDNFKQNLCYIVGLRYEVDYLPDPAGLGELHELFDMHTCWVKPFTSTDAHQFIIEEMVVAPRKPSEHEVEAMLSLTGGYPALLKAVCYWWRTDMARPPLEQWAGHLLSQPSIQNRLEEMWQDLTQEEQLTLSEAAGGNYQPSKTHQRYGLNRLADKGLCQPQGDTWEITGELLAAFASRVEEQGRGRIWWDDQSSAFWQGTTRLDLSPQQQAALQYFMQNSHKRLTKTDLIMQLWPDEWEEVDETRLYTLIRQLRRKIDPTPPRPCYIVNWRGTPEGGYQFFPEGRAG